MNDSRYVIGIDLGTSAARAAIIAPDSGDVLATAAVAYASGEFGILTDPTNRDVARQHPGDHMNAAAACIKAACSRAQENRDFDTSAIAGLGIDATGSTPLPVDGQLRALGVLPEFENELDAQAWLWKDHSAHAEAQEITELALRRGLPQLASCGGAYSSEWFWSKALRCARQSPNVLAASAGWLELCDFVVAWLIGESDVSKAARGICAAGHKALYHPDHGGLPPMEFLRELHPELERIATTFRTPALPSDHRAGALSPSIAAELGLPAGIPIAVGVLDAHSGAVGSGCSPGTLVKILGTSTCDCIVAPLDSATSTIPGVAGVVPESILPGWLGIEAGQSAVGDIFHWFVDKVAPTGFGTGDAMHGELTRAATALRPGQSGLLALDWHNGNRCVLADPRLSGLVLGLSLSTTAPELYRAWIEATAFGARTILDRLTSHGVRVDRIVTCGGVAEKNPLLMQIYADVLERPLASASSEEACALGAAIFGAVAAELHSDVVTAQHAMTGVRPEVYVPESKSVAIYRRLHACYSALHDALGNGRASDTRIDHVMKELLDVRDGA